MSVLAEALSYPFFQRALLAGLLASIACGIVGSFVVVRRITSISGGLSHAAFGGVGLGLVLGFSPWLGAVLFTLACAAILGVVYHRRPEALEPTISTLWAGGMALGILLVSLARGPKPDLMGYLFGSILFVPADYLWIVCVLDLVLALGLVALFKELQAAVFDEPFAVSLGVPTAWLFHLILAASALVIVGLIRIVGIVLVIALLTVPAMIARQWAESLPRMVVGSIVVGAVCATGGLLGSYVISASSAERDVPSGPLVILLAIGAYGASSLVRALFVDRVRRSVRERTEAGFRGDG